MSTVDISKIKPGDKVAVWSEVSRVFEDLSGIQCTLPFKSFALEEIAQHVPAPREIKVGDRVNWTGSPQSYRHAIVRAVHGRFGWVEGDLTGEEPTTLCLSMLEHAGAAP